MVKLRLRGDLPAIEVDDPAGCIQYRKGNAAGKMLISITFIRGFEDPQGFKGLFLAI